MVLSTKRQAQRSASAGGAARGRQGAFGLGQGAPGFVEERAACRRQAVDTVVTLQQAGADFFFQPPDRSGQRWLGHVQALSGAAEAQLLGNRDELAELA
ncbi:hypothetical protein LT19_00391 [Pseudomonas aeruginosa]|nr:hypothetical protein LT19_00391 [Pseudomonas aeruginosa]